MRKWVIVAVLWLAVAIVASAAGQQWSVEGFEDHYQLLVWDDRDRLGLMVVCGVDGRPLSGISMLSMMVLGGETFDNGGFAMAFDDEPGEWYQGEASEASLFADSVPPGFVGRLGGHSVLRVRVFTWPAGRLDVRFDLANASEALRLLPCVGQGR